MHDKYAGYFYNDVTENLLLRYAQTPIGPSLVTIILMNLRNNLKG